MIHPYHDQTASIHTANKCFLTFCNNISEYDYNYNTGKLSP